MSPRTVRPESRRRVEVFGRGPLAADVHVDGVRVGCVAQIQRSTLGMSAPWRATYRRYLPSIHGPGLVERYATRATKRAAVAWVVLQALGGEWDALSLDLDDVTILPPDLLGLDHPADPCDIEGPPGLRLNCTRPIGHTGRHHAGDGLHVHAVWNRYADLTASEACS